MTAKQKKGLFGRLRERLNSGNSFLTRDLGELVSGVRIDDDTLEELETRLLSADVGMDATLKIIDALEARIKRKDVDDLESLYAALHELLLGILAPVEQPLVFDNGDGPYVLLVTGVNGAGKTTTIGKLAARLKGDGKRVMLAAADTFRAAAIEQLQAWGERHDVPVVAQQHGADPAAVAHDAVQAASSRDIDVLIIDTAGRLQTQGGLMDELAKVRRVIAKQLPGAPHETLLVIDGTTGQNAINQVREFDAAVALSGLVVTKLDGTAKGGIVFALAEQFGLPLRYIGIGEAAEDLQVFAAEDYVSALLHRDPSSEEQAASP
ncbi:MAG: signal recognition particle-docking protein FtsY [Gammaproteobacteria bacterium]|nr:signal recognition particle-docking protein FtsY [Gammaproteobacteria bacterium]